MNTDMVNVDEGKNVSRIEAGEAEATRIIGS